MKKAIKTILLTLSLAMALWFMASWVDLVTHNTKIGSPDYAQYKPWNFLVVEVKEG